MSICLPCALVCGGCGYSVVVRQGEAGIMTSFGRYIKTLGPGFYYFNTCLYQIKKVNLKLQQVYLTIKSVQTFDTLTIAANAFVTYKCTDPFLMTYCATDMHQLITDLGIGILKRLINKNNFRTVMLKKKEIGAQIQLELSGYLAPAGVEIKFSDITQILLAPIM